MQVWFILIIRCKIIKRIEWMFEKIGNYKSWCNALRSSSLNRFIILGTLIYSLWRSYKKLWYNIIKVNGWFRCNGCKNLNG